MSKLKKFVSVLGSAMTLVAACAPLNSMALDPAEKIGENSERVEEIKLYRILTVEEYLSLELTTTDGLYRTEDNFLIDKNMNYLDVNGNVITDENNKVYIDLGKKFTYHAAREMDHQDCKLGEAISLHPILQYLGDHQQTIKWGSCGSNGEKCFLTCDPNHYLVLQGDNAIRKQANNIRFDSLNEVISVGKNGVGGHVSSKVDADVVYFPKKMLKRYKLKECESERLNELKEAEKKYLENKAKEKENVENKEELKGQSKTEQLQEANIDNGEKSSNLWKWMLGAGLIGGAVVDSGRRLLLNGSDNNTDESTYETEPLENNLNNDNNYDND